MRKSSLIVFAGLLAIALAFSPASAAVTNGSILVADGTNCGGTWGCFAWVNAGCPVQAARTDGVDFSAADITAAVGKTVTFRSVRNTPIDFGGDFVNIQFLNAQCKYVTSAAKQFTLGATNTFVMASAKWMVVTGSMVSSSRMTWSLTY